MQNQSNIVVLQKQHLKDIFICILSLHVPLNNPQLRHVASEWVISCGRHLLVNMK